MALMAGSKPVFLKDELTVVLGASGVYALRMLGLYMALPVMSTWAAGLPGATPFLVGLALGAYGLTQAIFQVPAGLLGDVRGRRQLVKPATPAHFSGIPLGARWLWPTSLKFSDLNWSKHPKKKGKN